jgi:uncharacterized delta-60 repeat protein
MRPTRLLALSLVVQLIAAATAAAAAPHAGSFDRGFGDNGRVTVRLPGEPLAPAAMAVQHDRRIVVAGTLPGAMGTWPGEWSGRAFAMRFLPDGALDPTFGDGGIARATFPYPVSIEGLALQPDGALVLSGISQDEEGVYRGVVVRLLSSGRVDESFGSRGITRVPGPGGYPVNSLAHVGVQPDGRIVAAGSQYSFDPHTAADPYVVRLTSNGAPDQSFGSNGVASIGTANPIAVLPQPDGDTVVVGTDEEYFGGSGLTLLRVSGSTYQTAYRRYRSSLTGTAARLRPDGTIDFVGKLVGTQAVQPRFLFHARIGRDLEVLEQHRARVYDLLEAAFDARGAVLSAGRVLHSSEAPPFRIARYRDMHRLDRSFGSRQGARNVFFERPGALTDLSMQDDRLIVAGYTHPRDHRFQGTSLTLVGLHARQDGAGPRVAVRVLGRRHGCLRGTGSIRVRIRDESRTRTRVRVDGRRLESTTRKRFKVPLETADMKPGRHDLAVRATDAAGNLGAVGRTFFVCG